MSKSKKLIAHIGVLAGVLTLAAGAYGYTAANVVPDSKAGDGTGTISGYTVSAIHYTLNSSDPSKVDSVTYTLDSAPVSGSSLQTKIAGTWYNCTDSGANVTCDTTVGTHLAVLNATSLQAIVAD